MLFNFNELRYSYEKEYDVFYCRINRRYTYDYTIPATPYFNIDVSKDGEIVAFELLDASEVLGVSKKELSLPKIKITVSVNKDVIKIVFNLQTIDDNMSSYIRKVLNENNILEGVFIYYL